MPGQRRAWPPTHVTPWPPTHVTPCVCVRVRHKPRVPFFIKTRELGRRVAWAAQGPGPSRPPAGAGDREQGLDGGGAHVRCEACATCAGGVRRVPHVCHMRRLAIAAGPGANILAVACLLQHNKRSVFPSAPSPSNLPSSLFPLRSSLFALPSRTIALASALSLSPHTSCLIPRASRGHLRACFASACPRPRSILLAELAPGHRVSRR